MSCTYTICVCWKVAFADRILLNKCDLVDEPQLIEVERRIRMINEGVKIQRTTKSQAKMDGLVKEWKYNCRQC